MKKTAFVTGGAGFLGRHLIGELLRQDWEVHALVRGEVPDWMRGERITVRQGSLQDLTTTTAAIPRRADAVFHVAAATTMWMGDLDLLLRDNVAATRTLLRAALQREARRVVATSTLGLFRTDLGVVDEQSELRGDRDPNPYLRSKRMADDLLQQATRDGLLTVSLHPSHMLGPFDKAGWIRMFDDVAAGKVRAAPGGRACFSPVREVACAHVAAAEHAHPAARYVLAGPQASYLEVFAGIAARLNARPVTATVPAPLLKAVGRLSALWSQVSGRRPALNPALAEILTGDILGDSRLAETQLGYRAGELEAMLDASFEYWRMTRIAPTRRMSRPAS